MPEPISILIATGSLALGGASWLYRNRGEILTAAIGFRLGRLAAREGAQVRVLVRGTFLLGVSAAAVLGWFYRDVLAGIDWSFSHATLIAGLTVVGYRIAGWLRAASDHLLTAGVATLAGRCFEACRPQRPCLTPVRTGAVMALTTLAISAATVGAVRAHDEVSALLHEHGVLAEKPGGARN